MVKSLKNKKMEKMAYGFKCVEEAKSQNIANFFKSHIKNIPMYIAVNGLIPTLAFIMSKSNKSNQEAESYRYIRKIIIEYLTEINVISEGAKISFQQNKIKGFEILTSELFAKSATEYRKCTLEVLRMLEWTVKFADGMIEKKNKGTENGEEARVNEDEG